MNIESIDEAIAALGNEWYVKGEFMRFGGVVTKSRGLECNHLWDKVCTEEEFFERKKQLEARTGRIC